MSIRVISKVFTPMNLLASKQTTFHLKLCFLDIDLFRIIMPNDLYSNKPPMNMIKHKIIRQSSDKTSNHEY